MFKKADVQKAVDEFTTKIAVYREENNFDDRLRSAIEEVDREGIRDLFLTAQKFAVAALPDVGSLHYGTGNLNEEEEEGVEVPFLFPQMSVALTPVSLEGQEGINSLAVVLSTRKNAPIEYKVRASFQAATINTQQVFDLFSNEYAIVLKKAMEATNVRVLNEQFARVVEASGIPFNIEFTVSNGSKGHFIDGIDDANVAYAVDEDLIFADEEAMLVADYTKAPFANYPEATRRKAVHQQLQREIEVLKAYATPVEYVYGKTEFVSMFVRQAYFAPGKAILHSISNTEKALRRALESETGTTKETIYRIEKGDVIGFVSLLGKDVNVVLHPFQVKKGTPVDVDILEGIR